VVCLRHGFVRQLANGTSRTTRHNNNPTAATTTTDDNDNANAAAADNDNNPTNDNKSTPSADNNSSSRVNHNSAAETLCHHNNHVGAASNLGVLHYDHDHDHCPDWRRCDSANDNHPRFTPTAFQRISLARHSDGG
jgi:hypothetical protein